MPPTDAVNMLSTRWSTLQETVSWDAESDEDEQISAKSKAEEAVEMESKFGDFFSEMTNEEQVHNIRPVAPAVPGTCSSRSSSAVAQLQYGS